jgi:hypothetical protein
MPIGIRQTAPLFYAGSGYFQEPAATIVLSHTPLHFKQSVTAGSETIAKQLNLIHSIRTIFNCAVSINMDISHYSEYR